MSYDKNLYSISLSVVAVVALVAIVSMVILVRSPSTHLTERPQVEQASPIDTNNLVGNARKIMGRPAGALCSSKAPCGDGLICVYGTTSSPVVGVCREHSSYI